MPWFFKSEKEKARDKARKAARDLDKLERKECKYYSENFPIWLARMGIDHWLARPDRPSWIEEKITGVSGRQKVKILEARYSPHAIYLWVDTRELPYRMRLPDLYADDVLETLSHNAQRQVAWRANPGSGCWYVIWRDGAINAIPPMFAYSEAVQMIPKNAPPLTFIVGVAENNALIKADLAMMPHYLVAGTTFTGKSVHLNQLLCQFISRNTPAELQFAMVDLKGGTEFSWYEGLPHLRWPIISKPDQVVPALEEFQDEMTRRQELINSHHAKTIEGFNNQYPDKKLPYLVMVFDELSQVLKSQDTQMSKAATLILGNLLATCRSAGGHVILCTQKPSSDVIATYIKTNAPVRICFAVPSNTDSIVVIDRGDAAGLKPVGRAIYQAGPDLTEVQSPFISDTQIERIVRDAIKNAGTIVPSMPEAVTLQDILIESVENYGGKLHSKPLYEAFRHRIARDAIEQLLKEVQGKEVIVQGVRYRCVNKGKGMHGGRRLEAIEPPEDPPVTIGKDMPELAQGEPVAGPVLAGLVTAAPHTLLKPAPIPAGNGHRQEDTIS